jgi:hypothetical protein
MKKPYFFPIFSLSILLFSKIIVSDALLTVKTEPSGIEIWLEDKYLGDSPIINKIVKPGKYTLRLVDAFQHTSTQEHIDLKDGESVLVEKTIDSKFGSLRINSKPAGAQVYISNNLGKTPLVNDYMNPGKYRVELRHPHQRYKIYSEDIIINPGDQVELNRTLPKEKIFNKKGLIKIGLGAGALAGIIFATVSQGDYKDHYHQYRSIPTEHDKGKYENAKIYRNVAISGSILCLVGLEIVSFIK